MDIEIEGVKQVKNSHLNAILVFIQPPSIEELERRLHGRKTETPESLKKRLDTARIELAYGTPDNFHRIVENHGHPDEAYVILRDFIMTELEAQFKEGINVTLKRAELQDKEY